MGDGEADRAHPATVAVRPVRRRVLPEPQLHGGAVPDRRHGRGPLRRRTQALAGTAVLPSFRRRLALGPGRRGQCRRPLRSRRRAAENRMSLYESALRHVIWPAYEGGLRRRDTPRHMRRYEADQWLSRERIEALQFERLQRLLAWCYREVPFYRERWTELGIAPQDIRSLADFAKLPVLTKADIRNHGDALKATSLKAGLGYKATGGSTGEPLRFGFTRESNDRRVAVMWRGYSWAGSRMGRRTLFLWGGPVGNPSASHQLKDRLYNAVFARKLLNSFEMTETNLASYADAIDAYRPEVIVSYVGPLVRLAEWLLANNRRVASPASIIGAAEALHPFQREIIEKAFGAPAFNTYGCREFM